MFDETLIPLIDAGSSPLLVRDYFADGDPGPIVAALAHVPELCEVALPFVGAALAPSAVSFRHKEIAILRTSANLSCKFCINAHTVVAFESGLSHGEVRALRGEVSVEDAFDDAVDRALIDWIDALTLASGVVPAAVAHTARQVLSSHELVELTVTVGTTMLLNRFATGFGLPTSDDTITRLAELGFSSYQHSVGVTLTAPSESNSA